MSKVLSIEPVGFREVYDIYNVEDLHHFVVRDPDCNPVEDKGIVSHNCFIDEANFYRGSTKENSPENIAEAIYSATDRRLTSRFQIGTEVPGLIIIASSERTEEDFVKKLIQKNRDRPDFKVISKALWEVKPAKYFSGKKFRVFIGDATRSSKILEDDAVVPEEDQARVIEVPVEYRKSFESNLDASIRDIAGRATVSVSPLIKDREYLREIMETSDLKHPFTKEVLTSSHLANTPRLKSYLDLNYLCKIQQSQYKPRRNPDAKRYIHIDLSTSGCATGFCMTHIPSFRRVAKVDEHGVVYYTLSPYIVVDMIVKIEPPVVGEIDYEDIREFVYYLSGLGFKIGEISTDGFQSVDMRQQFNKAGYNTSVVSVDRNDLAYLTMLSAINEDRLDVYLYEPLYEQLITLQHDIIDGKVHKSSSGEKDVSDALAGATYLAMLRESKSTTTYSGKTINRSVKVKSGDDQVQTEAAENRLSEKILSGALLGYRR